MTYSRESRGRLEVAIGEERLLTVYTRYCESSKSLEGDCGMDKVPRCRLLMPFQEGTHNKLLAKEII